jgi:hypothetical protein
MNVPVLTRAQFLIRAGVAALAAGGPPALSATRARAATVIGRSHFTPHLGGTFYVTIAGGRTSVRLTAIEDVAGARNDERSFALSFRGRRGAFEQGMYTVTRSGAGRMQLFLVPVGRPTGPTQQYQALFNRKRG